jgi:Ras GTPase-activating-like protein IQGAP2/3
LEAPSRDDPLRLILSELDGVPNLGSEELKDARDRAITLDLTNRFADVRGNIILYYRRLASKAKGILDPNANEKALWVQAKRGVLAVLRVQPATDLVESLLQPVTEVHEVLWDEIVENELIYDNAQQQNARRMPSNGVNESAYRLEDIQS